jgi:hypothetical protein
MKRIYKLIARLTGKSSSDVSSIHQIEDAEDGSMMFDLDQIAYQVKKNNIIHFVQSKDTLLSKVAYHLQEYNLSEVNEPTSNQQSKQAAHQNGNLKENVQHMVHKDNNITIRITSWTL